MLAASRTLFSWAVVDEDKAAGVGVLLTFRPTDYAGAGLEPDVDDPVPF